MSLRRAVAAILFFTVCVATARTAAASEQTCELTNSSLSIVAPHVEIALDDFGANVGPLRSSAHFTFVNHTAKPITQILILAEFLNAQGQHAISIPFHAGTVKQLITGPSPWFLKNHDSIDDAIPPGGSKVLSADVYATTSACPVRVQTSVVKLWFLDGSEFHHRVDHWELDPSIREAHPFDIESFPINLPFRGRVRVSISADGKVISTSGPDNAIRNWFEHQLTKWSFAPAFENDTAVASDITLIFRLDKYEFTDSEEHDLPAGKLMFIDVIQESAHSDRQFVRAGGLPLLFPGDL